MFFVGIDVAKDKHDCYIVSSEGEVPFGTFTITNNLDGFELLFSRIKSVAQDLSKIKVGLEATGHYSYNILGFLLGKDLPTFVFNPLHINLFRKSQSLRKTKTDKVDARTIATMLMSNVNLESYSYTLYHNEELKSLTRYRFDMVKKRAQLKQSISRLVTILFPELEKQFSTLHSATVYALLSEAPDAKQIASMHITRLTNIIEKASHGKLGKDKAIEIRDAARKSIGSSIKAKSLELKHTIQLINTLTDDIDEVEAEIQSIMDELDPPILSIPVISYRMGAMILAEIGDISRFSSSDKLLAYAGLSPSTYQSGQLNSSHSKMEKRGSRYLRYALYNAIKYVCFWDPTFSAYLSKKRAEGKHYNVALSHAAKKLVRVIFAIQHSGETYLSTA